MTDNTQPNYVGTSAYCAERGERVSEFTKAAFLTLSAADQLRYKNIEVGLQITFFEDIPEPIAELIIDHNNKVKEWKRATGKTEPCGCQTCVWVDILEKAIKVRNARGIENLIKAVFGPDDDDLSKEAGSAQ